MSIRKFATEFACFAHARPRAYAFTNSFPKRAGRRRGLRSRAPCLWAPLSRSQPVCPAGQSPVSPRRPAYQGLTPPGLWNSRLVLVNHSCPLSWLRRSAARFPHPGNVAGNFEWPSPARPPLPDASPRWGPGKAAGKPSGFPGDPRRPLPEPPPGQSGPFGKGPPASPRRARTEGIRAPCRREGGSNRPLHSIPPWLRPTVQIRAPSSSRCAAPKVLPSCAPPRLPLPTWVPSVAERPDLVTRAATARTSPCPPSPRVRRGRARQEPGRDAPGLPGGPRPSHLLSGEGRCREGEGRGGTQPQVKA